LQNILIKLSSLEEDTRRKYDFIDTLKTEIIEEEEEEGVVY